MSKMNVRPIIRRIDAAAVRELIEARAPDLAAEIDWSIEGDSLNDAIEAQLDRGGADGGKSAQS